VTVKTEFSVIYNARPAGIYVVFSRNERTIETKLFGFFAVIFGDDSFCLQRHRVLYWHCKECWRVSTSQQIVSNLESPIIHGAKEVAPLVD